MLIVVDVESDGPVPGLYSMVSFAAVVVEPGLKRTFRGEMAPISDIWIPEALAISCPSREVHLTYQDPEITMDEFDDWMHREFGDERQTLISDNPCFDFAFLSYYSWRYLGKNQFGHSGRRINDLFAGAKHDASATQGWKKFRKTKHTHDPLDDAMGMAEALLKMKALEMLRFVMIPEAA